MTQRFLRGRGGFPFLRPLKVVWFRYAHARRHLFRMTIRLPKALDSLGRWRFAGVRGFHSVRVSTRSRAGGARDTFTSLLIAAAL